MNQFSIILLSLFWIAGNSQEQPIAIIPLHQEGAHTYIALNINDSKKPYNFIFDTGAGITVASALIIEEANIIKSAESSELDTAGDSNSVPISNHNSIHIEGLTLNNICFYIDDISHMSQNGIQIDGVIGYDLLKDYVTFLNYEKNQLELYPSNTTSFDNYKSTPFTLVENLPTVELDFLTANGKSMNGRFYFDSGGGFSISFNSSFSKKNNLKEAFANMAKTTTIGGANGAGFDNYLTSIVQLNMQEFEFSDLPALISLSEKGASSSEAVDGIIGIDIIKRFNIALNYKKQTMVLIPNSHYSDAFNFNLTGFGLRQIENKIVITNLIDGSPAQEAGFQKNDIIVSVDGHIYESASEIKRIINVANKDFYIQIKRGDSLKTIQLQPRRFY